MFQSKSNRADGYSCFSAPRAKTLRLAVVGNFPCAPSIRALLSGVFPAAVFWAVVALVIYAPNGMAIAWARSHIGHEIREPHLPAPTVADFDAARTIVLVCRAFGVDASRPDSPPAPVSVRVGVFLAKAMNSHNAPERFSPYASARSGVVLHEMGNVYHLGISAIALAEPKRFAAFSVVNSDSLEASKAFARDIEYLSHGAVYLSPCSSKKAPEEAQLHEGFFRGIPLSGIATSTNPVVLVNT